MRKELYSIKCPGRIIFGDSLYFEEYTGKRLSDLVVDIKPPKRFRARLTLEEKENQESPDFVDRFMTIYMASKQEISTYMEGYKYAGEEMVIGETVLNFTISPRVGVN